MATIDELGLTPYQRIMAQMTPTMNPYTGASQALGGYDPELYRRMSGSGLINLGVGGGGMVGGGGGYNQPIDARTAAFFDNETKEARDARMGQVSNVLQGLVKFAVPGAGLFSLAQGYMGRQGNVAAGLVAATEAEAIARDNARQAAYDQDAANNAQIGADLQAAINAQSMQSMQDALAADTAAAQGLGGGGGYSASDYGGYSGSETQSSGESYANFKGGLIDKVAGPNPPGPDDGAGMLQLGEYVIKKSAVKKYGQGLLDMINDGKIPAKKMKSLLG